MNKPNEHGTTLDYLTMTTEDDDIGTKWFKTYQNLEQTHPECHGRKRTDFNWLGYQSQSVAGALLWGYKPSGGYIFQAISSFADDVFHLTYDPKAKVTRADLAVTVKLSDPDEHLAKRHYNRLVKGKAGDRKTTYVTNSRGGDTLYVGSTKSTQFGRLYDKGMQQASHDAGILWRYETVIRKPLATPLLRELVQEIDKDGWDKATRARLSRYCFLWWLDRGIKPVYRTENVETPSVGISYTRSDAKRKLKWIKEQVYPSVLFLLDQGFQEELQEALSHQLVLPGTELTKNPNGVKLT